jgi:hypothetical protein
MINELMGSGNPELSDKIMALYFKNEVETEPVICD